MKILFVMKTPGDVRQLGSVLRQLGERGHRIHLAFQGIKTRDSRFALDALLAESPGITFEKLPSTGSSGWTYLARSLRLGIDYLRFIDPMFGESTKLRGNIERKMPAGTLRVVRGVGRLGPTGARAARRVLQALERSIVPPSHVERFVAEHEADVFMISPLVGAGSTHADFLRAAKRLGLRTAYPVLSWDNLTTKGLVRDVPDLVLVWNEGMAEEARTLHGIPPDRICIAGAAGWDHWFGRSVERNREDFCAEVGLRADRPFVLYVGSSWWVIEDEVDFVGRWAADLRAHGGLLEDAGILVRPHPQRDSSEWGAAELDDPQIAVWPRFGQEPLGDRARQNYFESIYHSAAVFGISTSAQIEAAIVGRPVHTLITGEFRGRQLGTVHFKHLEDESSSPLVIARTLEEHADLLERSLRGELPDRNERFVRSFVRPHGLDVPATPLYVEAIEDLAGRPAPAPGRGPRLGPILRLAMRPLVRLAVRDADRRREAKPATPERELRAEIRRLARKPDRPVLAGPWTGDEIGELLFWLPFLRWVETSAFGLAERLHVVVRPETASWYRGLQARLVTKDEAAGLDADLLPAETIAGLRSELAAQDPAARLQGRLLDFALLAPPDLPDRIELPAEYVAVRFDRSHGPLSIGAPVVVLGGDPAGIEGEIHVVHTADRGVEAAILASSRAYVGSYGPSAYVASLVGVPGIAITSASDEVAPDHLRIAGSFLARPPFGRLRVVEEPEAAAALADVLEPAAGALASTS